MPENVTMDILKQRLQARKHKMTTQRRIVLEVFLANPGEHLSADEVHKILRDQSKDIGLATVYRTIELLVELKILQKNYFNEKYSRYEIRTADPNEHQHHHLLCMGCNKVFEFSEDLLDELEKEVFEKTGFKIVDHQVKLYGYCHKCQQEK